MNNKPYDWFRQLKKPTISVCSFFNFNFCSKFSNHRPQSFTLDMRDWQVVFEVKSGFSGTGKSLFYVRVMVSSNENYFQLSIFFKDSIQNQISSNFGAMFQIVTWSIKICWKVTKWNLKVVRANLWFLILNNHNLNSHNLLLFMAQLSIVLWGSGPILYLI